MPGQATNGEFVPKAPTRRSPARRNAGVRDGGEIAAQRGIDRRRFLQGMGGMAVTLAAINLSACEDGGGGSSPTPGASFAVPTDADPDAVCEMLEGDEFIFDVQTHHVDPGAAGAREPGSAGFFRTSSEAIRHARRPTAGLHQSLLLHPRHLPRERHAHRRALRHAVRSERHDPLKFEEMKRRATFNELSPAAGASHSLHSVVVPNAAPVEAALERCRRAPEALDVAAWKSYTPYGPTGRGWILDDDIGIPVIETGERAGRQDDLRSQGAASVRVRSRATRRHATSASSRRLIPT